MSSKRGKGRRGGKRQNIDEGDKKGDKKGSLKKQRVITPTVQEIISDDLTQLSIAYWAPLSSDKNQKENDQRPFVPKIVEEIYLKELRLFKLERIMILELSHYLENFLWKNYEPKKVSFGHLMSIIIMVNEKFRQGVSPWDCFHSKEDLFPAFFEEFLEMRTTYNLSISEKTNHIIFLINCFQSLEDAMVRKEALKLTSLPLWNSLNPERLNKEIKALPKIERLWNSLKKQKPKGVQHEKTFIPNLLEEYLNILYSINENSKFDADKIHYCERFVELLLDLISQLPTRRFFHVVMQDKHIVVKSQMSPLASHPQGRLFTQLVDMLRFFDGFEVNDFTGDAYTEEDIINQQIAKVRQLQRIAFKHFEKDLKSLALSNVASLETKEGLLEHLKTLPDSQLRELCVKLALLPEKSKEKESREFMIDIIVVAHERRLSQLEVISEMPIYPTEEVIWNDNLIPSDEYTGESCLALPKLNLQFLTFYDYLLRNFDLFRLESAYEIRQDVEDAIRRCNPRRDPANKDVITWTGWSRMALPIKEFNVTFVGKPKLGEEKPSEVRAEITYSIHTFKGQMRDEWDSIKLHDVLFLVTCRPSIFVGDQIDSSKTFVEQYGVDYVRGCEVLEILDEEGNLIRDWEIEESSRKGNVRTLRVRLDASQYKHDLDQKDEDVNGTFNLLVRRKPKENNFKAVLETIRDLMNTRTVVPDWLHDIFLGYGDPNDIKEESDTKILDFVDTFLNAKHAAESFPNRKIKITEDGKEIGMAGKVKEEKLIEILPPFKLQIPASQEDPLILEKYIPPHRGPYPQDIPKKNTIPFTSKQVEAIRSSMSHGLTLVVGPPGTGKTDVAVQIISNWYHNFPNQRTLLVTHSNQALNQLFEKIMALDIHEKHLIRLGHGGEYLETTKDFSKYGRVNYMLSWRLELLAEADRLSKTLGIPEDIAYTCETAEHFYLSRVLVDWNQYQQKLNENKGDVDSISNFFPFKKFFATSPQPLFQGKSYDENIKIAYGCWRHIDNIFTGLRECRPFELMRNPVDRANYLVTRQARIIAMTCTHAALKRHELVELGFKYDNLLMEEAAQILEIETFIPMLLQEHDVREGCRLKRVVLIGDHHQLPPIIKNIAFQKYAHMDQSLFTRFVRLGVPTIDLDAQGRARPSIAKLYNWRYKSLRDLPNVVNNAEFQLANAGFMYDFQAINVSDYDDHGEISPSPFFYQNLGEAEYVVAVFMYMRLLGYPAEKISILTTYNGQKHLIRDVLKARTQWNPYYGKPKVSTVDRYQGQQNDYILLSLVRTKTVGHLRDIRRLVVAMSRARLGLYVFCRRSLFENCYELTATFAHFIQKPDKLQLVQGENYPTTRKVSDDVVPFQVEDVVHLGELVAGLQKKFSEEQKAQSEREALKRAEIEENIAISHQSMEMRSVNDVRMREEEEEEEEEDE